jgi:hypothetical protein
MVVNFSLCYSVYVCQVAAHVPEESLKEGGRVSDDPRLASD